MKFNGILAYLFKEQMHQYCSSWMSIYLSNNKYGCVVVKLIECSELQQKSCSKLPAERLPFTSWYVPRALFFNSFNNWNCEDNKIQVEQKKTLIVIRTCCNIWTVCLFTKCYGIERVLVFFLISIILYTRM